MRASELLAALPASAAPRQVGRIDADPVIRGLEYDSRKVTSGDLFFALPGAVVDGHDYLDQAVANGAAAIVVEHLPDAFDTERCLAVVVPDSRRAMAPIATRFFGSPSAELHLLGITGTNGKTSTTYLIESILRRADRKVGLIGTIEIRYADVRERSLNTTPESLDLQRTLRNMCTRGIETVVMEVSSHGLELGRVEGCRFDIAAVGNVTQDHLDFHGTMDSYRESKILLFSRHQPDGAIAVVNLDDPSAGDFISAARRAGSRLVRVSRDATADAEIRLAHTDVSLDGTHATVTTPIGELELDSPLVGDFNIENLLVACGVAVAAGVGRDAIEAGVADCPQVPGRVERIKADIPGAPSVIVDYAHTPDAVLKLLEALRPLCKRRLITVFGCGGDRDRSKRPLMAQAVANLSDRVIATSDNPRTEDPERILADVGEGLSALHRVEPDALRDASRSYTALLDRREAIELAIEIAGPEDTVVLAGKGHEDYQILGRTKVPFDDREEALRALRQRWQAT
jgi:UDP-N-acetylmuramoyl-L-alanyl-D-glutamate--2,6-diaminopimelate ligase